MAFPTGWNQSAELVIQASQVSSALTDFPLLLTADTLPSEMFDADGSNPAQNGGGDIRFSSDAAGSTQLACEVVSFVTDNNPANGTAQIWVKVPSVSASGDTSVYVWWDTSGTDSQPSVTDTYGRNAVWANYERVYHLEESVSTATGHYVDSSGNQDGTLNNSTNISTTTGPAGLGTAFASSNKDDVEYGISTNYFPSSSTGTLQFFINLTDVVEATGFGSTQGADDRSNRRFYVGVEQDGNFFAGLGTGFCGLGTLDVACGYSDGTWHHIAMAADSGTARIYSDGSQVNTFSYTFSGTSTLDFTIGYRNREPHATALDGATDEYRVSNEVISAAQLDAEYTNQTTPSLFVAPVEPVAPTLSSPSVNVTSSTTATVSCTVTY